MLDINTIPKELVEKRQIIECNWIFCLYNDPTLISDYKNVKNTEDIITTDGIFYYGLARELYKLGHQVFDNISIYSFLEGKPTLKKKYEELGGFETIKEITNLISVDNVDGYYDELAKNNLLIRLHQSGFPVIDRLDKFSQMTSSEVYDYYDYLLANVSVDKIEKIKVEDLSDGYDAWLEEMDQSQDVGFKVGSGIMDYILAGVHKENLTLYLAGMGKGKSSSSIPLFILPAIETGNDVTILCNEQNSKDYRNMIICTVLFQKLTGVKGLNRTSIIRGHYSDLQKEHIREAIAWIKKQPGKIKFVEMADYDVNNVKKVIKRQSKLGCSYFIFDVLKNTTDASDKSWALLSDTAKTLFMLAKNEKVAIVATAQLAFDSMNRTYLDNAAIGKSRGIGECASTIVMFREVQPSEFDKIKPWQWKKNPDGSTSKIKVEYTLDPDKHYIIMFIPKNRFGSTAKQVVMEFNQDFNTLTDVGYCVVPSANFQRR